MKGCLTLPFRLAFLALLALGLLLAWSYRRELRRAVHRWTADSGSPAATGRADPARAAPARRRIDSLQAAGRDSVVLSATEVASLIGEAVAAGAPGAVDSVEVTLDDDDVEVHARVDTRRLPLSLGPAAGMVHDHESVDAGGRLVLRRAGAAEWDLARVRVRGLPLPRELVAGLMRRFTGRGGGGVVEIPVPRSVSGLRVSRAGLTLYGLAGGARP
jgi:hypothetical protein